jgi:hypothetical protein
VAVAPANQTASQPTETAGSGGQTANPQPQQQPQTQPQPQPQQQPQQPPQQQQQPTTPPAGTLLAGGVLKSVLGHSKADVKKYFQLNQSLGEANSTLRYLRGSTIVEIGFQGDVATSVRLQNDRLNTLGATVDDQRNALMAMAGMSQASPTSSSGSQWTWKNIYPGSSNIVVNLNISANSGSLQATL